MADLRQQAAAKARLDTVALGSWVVEQGLSGTPIDELFQAFCDRLHAAGFALARAYMGFQTLHPKFGYYGFLWMAGEEQVRQLEFEHGTRDRPDYRNSPIHYLSTTGKESMRRRLVGEGAVLDFPLMEDLRAAGLTDYAARVVAFGEREAGRKRDGMFFSCATDLPSGFGDDQLQQVGDLMRYLALAAKSRATYDVASNVVETYLGRDAGRRVLKGEIHRGSVETIRAVLWHCDLRGFTELADRIPTQELVTLLDDYLECLAAPVHAKGGQILKFMGDGFLATFDLRELEDERVCRTALEAAVNARAAVARLNEVRDAAGAPELKVGLALHLGDVLYGNIGARDRLDFTVIGPAVNEVSRIQVLCRDLDVDLLISKTFFEIACECQGELVSLGRHDLRGVRESQELFTIGQ